ncbi:unnamed protein product [Rotaria sordida]|uniref:DUF6875 domain-containing protein n=1 Tax=Rotaria sordida TaxID=392033 RepID=A0A815FCI3_9BILA|nr:unnamed protein product [Rotaria sordida]CAF1136288.1 unnamed protein product [Rotaria sordida]CAF1324313.1 unnamed protein product [Rotaria sordida]CAF1392075.1 unnamed protein product [Rotaria sordida]CAF1403037.1 unnamed protein product [Rotaria sordida]
MIKQCKYDFLYKYKLVYKCLIISIRSSDVSHNLIDEIQTELKSNCIIQYGLKFGEFHQSADSNTIQNENSYPFRTRKDKHSVEIHMKMINKYLNLNHSGLLYPSKTNHLQSVNGTLEELNSSIKE